MEFNFGTMGDDAVVPAADPAPVGDVVEAGEFGGGFGVVEGRAPAPWLSRPAVIAKLLPIRVLTKNERYSVCMGEIGVASFVWRHCVLLKHTRNGRWYLLQQYYQRQKAMSSLHYLKQHF